MLKLEHIYDVVVAKDGQEAYDMVKDSMQKGVRFNLIFMDIQVSNRCPFRHYSRPITDLLRCRISMACKVLGSFDRWDTLHLSLL